MLCFTRRLGESVVIGDGDNAATVTLLGITSRGQVRLGVQAPKHVTVDRAEVAERKAAGMPWPAKGE